ncbi:hypothetical protein KC571_02035 [candidate division WWE3 bacterium]|uniref:Uncharacterized protein n=1 Tax=candidate division WWE3 bacterium TaxID=2053526 RepID=A0A955LGS6_UNCKA|nr:hypothetical protein [candidate division WWE3 bacterium]
MTSIPVYSVEQKIVELLIPRIQEALVGCTLQLGRCLVPTALYLESRLAHSYPAVEQVEHSYFWRFRIRTKRTPLCYVKIEPETRTIILNPLDQRVANIITQQMFDEAVAEATDLLDLPGINLFTKTILEYKIIIRI